MNKRTKQIFSGITITSSLVTLQSFWTAPKAIAMESKINKTASKSGLAEKETYKAATLEQQKEIAKYCDSEVKKYWDKHDPAWAWDHMENDSPDVDETYEEFFKDVQRTYKEKIEFDEKYYNEALNNPEKNWDCKIVSGHMVNYLRKMGVKHRYAHYDKERDGKKISHDLVVYAVSEKSKLDPSIIEENWYVLDMQLMKDAELLMRNFGYKELPDVVYGPLKLPIDAASVPLEVYADNVNFGFGNTYQVFVFGNNEDAVLDKEERIDSHAPLIGEWVYKNCTENYRKKFLIPEITDKELKIIGSTLAIKGKRINSLTKLSRRLFLEEESHVPDIFRSFSLVVSHKGKLIKFPTRAVVPYDESAYHNFILSNKNAVLYYFQNKNVINGIPFNAQFS